MIATLYAILWGATWGNNMAWLESLAVAALAGYVLHRLGVLGHLADKAGHHLAAWWARHHGPHAIEQHKQALRELFERGPGGDGPVDGARLRSWRYSVRRHRDPGPFPGDPLTGWDHRPLCFMKAATELPVLGLSPRHHTGAGGPIS